MNFENAFIGSQSIQVCHLRSKTPLTSVDRLRGPPRPIQRGRWPATRASPAPACAVLLRCSPLRRRPAEREPPPADPHSPPSSPLSRRGAQPCCAARRCALTCCQRVVRLGRRQTSGGESARWQGRRAGAGMARAWPVQGCGKPHRPGAGRVTVARRRPNGGRWRWAELRHRELCTIKQRAG